VSSHEATSEHSARAGEEPLTADQGWNRLMHALAFKTPRRLTRINRSRAHLRAIRRNARP
jgi:hypothetical protein